MGTHGVKIKLRGAKTWQFLTPKGGLTRLRLHAAMSTPERAAEYAADILASNPDTVEATKVVAVFE